MERLKQAMKNMQLEVLDHIKKEAELEVNLRQVKQTTNSLRSHRNVLGKNLLQANVCISFCY